MPRAVRIPTVSCTPFVASGSRARSTSLLLDNRFKRFLFFFLLVFWFFYKFRPLHWRHKGSDWFEDLTMAGVNSASLTGPYVNNNKDDGSPTPIWTAATGQPSPTVEACWQMVDAGQLAARRRRNTLRLFHQGRSLLLKHLPRDVTEHVSRQHQGPWPPSSFYVFAEAFHSLTHTPGPSIVRRVCVWGHVSLHHFQGSGKEGEEPHLPDLGGCCCCLFFFMCGCPLAPFRTLVPPSGGFPAFFFFCLSPASPLFIHCYGKCVFFLFNTQQKAWKRERHLLLQVRVQWTNI